MKNCSNCGKPLEDGAALCESCGAVALESPSAGNQTTCPHCGKALYANARFCPNCGKELSEASSPAQKIPASENKRRLIFGGAAAAVLVLLAVVIFAKVIPSLTGGKPAAQPAAQFVSYQKDLLAEQALSSLERTMDIYGAGSFSTDMTVTVSVDNDELNHFLTDSSLLMKLDLKPDSLVANGEFTLMGSSLFTGDFLYDKGTLEFALPDLNDSCYVMDLSKLASRLGGMDVDLSVLKLPEFSGKDWRTLAETYLDLVCTAVTEESVEMEKDVRFTLTELGGSYTGTTYTFTPRAEDVEAMLIKLAGQLEGDKTLRKLILELVNPSMLSAAFGMDVFDSADFEEELDEGLTELAEELRDNAADIGEAAEEAFTWTLYVEGKEVRMIRITDHYAEEDLVVECSGTEAEGLSTAFYVDSGDSDYRPFTVLSTYTKKGKAYTGEISFTSPHDGTIDCSYDIDTGKQSVLGIPYGTYDVDVSHDDISIKLEVADGSEGGTDHILTLRGNEYVFDDFSRMDITVNTTAKSSAKRPSGTTVDITGYSDEEYDELFEELGTAFYQDLMEKVEPLVG
ncbi:MAG: zinc ribbon domain-containing protein [Oscillospiraceae bacterium]|nr:zinc ribbon domain-containing protein [Oscillospiraceae bacterium]